MAKKEAPPAEAAEAAPAPSKKKKILILGVIALLILAIAGGGVLFLLKKKQASENVDEEEIAAEQKKVKKEEKKKTPPVFAKLDTFTVNLAQEKDNGDQYLQVAISLELEDAIADANLKASMPKVRDNIIRLLASKKAGELATTEGKDHLALSLKNALNRMLDPPPPPKKSKSKKKNQEEGEDAASEEEDIKGPVVSVLFTDFIIQ